MTADPIRRIGLLPGSFNPPHLGHVDLARKSCRCGGLEACFFYINSINLAKRAELIPWRQRRQLLELVLGGSTRFILGPDEFADSNGAEGMAQEAVFPPLMKQLARSYGQPSEVWLVRGSDNFRAEQAGRLPYPRALRDLPHVIGLRSDRHRDHDYAQIARKVFVKSTAVSSSDVREILAQGGTVGHLIGPAAEEYIRSHGLFKARQPTPQDRDLEPPVR